MAKLQDEVTTFEAIVGVEGLLQGIVVPDGSTINQLTDPTGAIGKAIPETVVVSVVVPPNTGLADATTPIPGVCLVIVRVNGVLVTVA